MHFTPGSLARARVPPATEPQLLRLRPLTIPSGEEIGLYIQQASGKTWELVPPRT